MNDLTCPLCDFGIEPKDRLCPNCGVDLALATAIAEHALSSGSILDDIKIVISPEILVPRIGEYLVERGKITDKQLEEALAYKKFQEEKGIPTLTGQSLKDLGYINQEVLDEVITRQIIKLQDALKTSNKDLEISVKDRTHDLQSALQKLTELNQLKANFVANISHELRSPMTQIKGYLELMNDGSLGALNQTQENAVTTLNKASGRLEKLIEDLIKFSDTTQGEFNLNRKAVPIQVIAKDILIRSFSKAEDKDIYIQLDVPSELPKAFADPENITSVMLQLVDNAIKFTPEGGEVILSAAQTGEEISISVRDTGIGIPEDQLESIFSPFHQLDGSSRRRYGGTGLGLSLVKRILEAHGTSLEVESIFGEGTKFEFMLPVDQNTSPIPESS